MAYARKNQGVRLGAMLLTVALLLALLPGMTYKAQATGSIVYTLNRTSDGANWPLRTLTTYGTRNWAYAGDTITDTNNPALALAASWQVKTAVGEWIALRVEAPAAGVYDVKFEFQKNAAAGWTDVYFIPAPTEITKATIEAAMANAESLGNVDQYGTSGTFGTVNLKGVAITGTGEHLMIFRATAKGHNGTGSNIYSKVLTLTPNPDAQASVVSLSSGEDTLTPGNTKTVETFVRYSNGASIRAAEGSATLPDGTALVEYGSAARAVFEVDSAGIVTASAPGSANLITTLKVGEDTYTHLLPITVAPSIANAVANGKLVLNAVHAQRVDIGVSGIAYDAFNSVSAAAPGTSITLTAADESESGRFLYWKSSVTDKIVSTDKQYTFTIGTDTQLTAVYLASEDGYLVEFFNRNGRRLDTQYLAPGTEITAPEIPYSVGHEFSQWGNGFYEGIKAEGNRVFVAEYTARDRYPITIVNALQSTPVGETYLYNTEIVLMPDESAAPPESEFAYWMRDGKIVSYEQEYRFYVWDNTTVSAVFLHGGDLLDAQPTVFLDIPKLEDGKAVLCGEWRVPEGYSVVESGILFADNSTVSLDSYSSKAAAQSRNTSGQFTAYKEIATGETWHARAYLIYRAADDECRVVYSDIAESDA